MASLVYANKFYANEILPYETPSYLFMDYEPPTKTMRSTIGFNSN